MGQFGEFHILLVDDDHSESQIFEAALKEASARSRLYWVATGKEALDFLHERGRFEGVGAIRIVVLDLHLGNDSGLDVLREIKESPDLNRTPVIMLSSSMSQSEIDLAYSLGANAYFRKPMTIHSYVELLRAVAQHWLDLAQLPSAASRSRERSSVDGSEQARANG